MSRAPGRQSRHAAQSLQALFLSPHSCPYLNTHPGCSTDLTEGVRASARALSSAEQGIRAAGNLAGRTVAEQLPKAQGAAEGVRQWKDEAAVGSVPQ